MTAQQVAVKRYIVKLSAEEREQLNTLIRTGKHRARQLMKARILLKADVSEAGEGGVTAGSPARWIPPSTRLPGPASGWWSRGSKRR